MHKLDRSSVPAPQCLHQLDYQVHDWDDLRGECKRQVQLALQRLQGQQFTTDDTGEGETIDRVRCAYCEGRIPAVSCGHIEHFQRKNRRRHDGYPELTFAWDNLFFSCNAQEHCGHFKDRPGANPYDARSLVKPDRDDPDEFFYLGSSGEIRVRNRKDMSDADRVRAAETIRVFNLDCATLRGARRRVLEHYKNRSPVLLDDLMTWDPELREEYVREELDKTCWEPYATVIRHFFQSID